MHTIVLCLKKKKGGISYRGSRLGVALFLGWSNLVKGFSLSDMLSPETPDYRMLILDLPQDQGKHQVGHH